MEVRRMEVRRRQKYVTLSQKQKLSELITQHHESISYKARKALPKRESQRLWQNIANECNSVHQGAKKTWRQWKKTWQDMQSKKRRRLAENDEPLASTERETSPAEEKLDIKDIKHTEPIEPTENHLQQSTEFITIEEQLTEENSQEISSIELPASFSDRDSPVEAKVFNSNHVKKSNINSSRNNSKHNCYFNCDVIAVQEQRKIQIKEDYLNFKKDYLRQKIKLLKEQTEALKSIAKELSM